MKLDWFSDYRVRIGILVAIGLAGFGILMAKLYFEQVRRSDAYRERISRQMLRRIRIPGQRGRIFTADLQILADNCAGTSAVFYPEEMRRPGRNSRKRTIEYIKLASAAAAAALGRPDPMTKTSIARHLNYYPGLPITVFSGLSTAEAAKILELTRLFDGIGMGLGFSFALTCIGAVREILSAGEVFGLAIMPESYVPVRIFGQAPGAFFVLACLVALQNYIKEKRKKAGKPYEKIGSGCSEDCMNCKEKGCTKRFYDAEGAKSKEEAPVAEGVKEAAVKAPVAGDVQKTTENEVPVEKPTVQEVAHEVPRVVANEAVKEARELQFEALDSEETKKEEN